MPDSFYLFFLNWEFFCFLILGLCLGRLGAVLALFLPMYEGCEDKEESEQHQQNVQIKDFIPFFIECQNKWGWYPLSSAVKKIRGQIAPLTTICDGSSYWLFYLFFCFIQLVGVFY